jgi:hypothetical protein
MNILINQPAGIGDIIFCQKIYHCLKNDNNKIYWPVKNSISWLTEYLDTVCKLDDIKNVKIDAAVNLDGCHYMIPNGKIMRSKYDILGLSFDDYLDYFKPKRNLEKEENLFNLKYPKEKYRLICNMYGTPSDTGYVDRKEIPESTTFKNVIMCLESGYTLFDWIKLIENAEEIYCTDSSIVLLVEKYYKKEGDLVAYSRRNYSGEVDYLLKKKWRHVI